MTTLNSTYLPGPELLFIFCSGRGFGPEEADERQGRQYVREDSELGPLLLAPRGGPAAGAAAVGQHQTQREEHQHAQQQLLVGHSDEVPALLIKIREGGKAEESPHDSQAPLVALDDVGILFCSCMILMIGDSLQNVFPKGAPGTGPTPGIRPHRTTIQIRLIYKILE